MAQLIKSSCPRDCYDGCGFVAEAGKNGQVRITGDPDHPIARGALCSKCGVAYNGVFQDESARLSTPLKRVGMKGRGEFVSISWGEALATIAERFNSIISAQGAESILTMKYTGTLSIIAYSFPSRWVNYVGASVVDYGSICNAAGIEAWELMFGTADIGFDPRTARDSRCILVWGANPSHSAPHMHKHWLKESPAKVVVVDPVRSKTAADADLHLQPRPGTDAALAFCLLHELREQGSFDQTFIDQHTSGSAEIMSSIETCTPEWGESVTGVRAADIRMAAEIYGSGPALLWAGQGLQRQKQGGNIMRAIGLLPAMTGNVGKPGAGFYYLNSAADIAGLDGTTINGASLASNSSKKVVGALDLADRLLDPEEFRAFVVWNTNPLASSAEQDKLRRAVSRDELFTVVIDLFETDTAKYADIVLPAASFLEFDDVTYSYFNLIMGAQSKVREPIGESLPNQEIFRRLSKAMDLEEPSLYERDESIITSIMTQCGIDGDFEEFRTRGYFQVGGDEPVMLHADLEFDTPTGRIEIASDSAEEQGLARVPVPTADAPPQNGQLRLLSPASNWRMNDSYANDKRLAVRAQSAELIVCREDAERLGLEDGCSVRVSTATGNINLTTQIDDVVQPGTALSYKGRWPSREGDAKNVNYLFDGEKCDMAESTSIHSMAVTVARA